jgi:NAD(P)-dependent dehydrogenase (short-subunit alcohol dehydrogenase family)
MNSAWYGRANLAQNFGMASQIDRTVAITGGNTGLGFACASAILRSPAGPPWRVILACRDEGRAKAAIDRLSGVAGVAGQVEAMSLDLASLLSVRRFAAEVTHRLSAGTIPPLRAVVCNAGVQSGTTRTVTADGFESTFGVNHLGHFALVDKLLPALEPPARVVVVASGTHDPAKKWGVPAPAWNDPADLARGELGPTAASDTPFALGQRRYTTSKLANVYFTYALARHLPVGVTANAFDPGLMPGTGLVREAPAPIRFVANHVMPRAIPLLRRVFSPNVHTVEESGDALARLVTDPELAATTGKYIEGYREIPSSDESYDTVRAEELWNRSLALTARP